VISREGLKVLVGAKTRPVASWLVKSMNRLPEVVNEVIDQIHRGDWTEARSALTRLCEAGQKVRYLLEGIRIVLAGVPNSGKSTLANQLAGRESAVVSEMAGTTRDWVEHSGAIEGVPCLFVDTAGVRTTSDPLEVEAIQRSGEQMRKADLILWIMDGSIPPSPADLAMLETRERVVYVWNKSDLILDCGHRKWLEQPDLEGYQTNGLTGEGIEKLRHGLLMAAGLLGWTEVIGVPFTSRQLAYCCRALMIMRDLSMTLSDSVLTEKQCSEAIKWLKTVISGKTSDSWNRIQ